MRIARIFSQLAVTAILMIQCTSPANRVDLQTLQYQIYPEVNSDKPDLNSPFISTKGEEYVVAVTKEKSYAIIPVTLSNERGICRQLIMDTLDFPFYVKHGVHSKAELDEKTTITGWTLDTITSLGRPEGLSNSGFMADDEDILSVISSDNEIVKKLDLTHPELARPLFHVLNMMDMDLSLDRWNMPKHRWDNITHFYYNGNKVHVEAYDTKGGQMSIFNDGIQGAFHIKIWHEFAEDETNYLKDRYGHLTEKEMEDFKERLSLLNIGEMQPQYIMRYGFYEGHTFWRACPMAISFIFGLKSLNELEEIFEGALYETISKHYSTQNQ